MPTQLENLKLEVIKIIKAEIAKQNLSQIESAQLLGVSPPRMSNLMHNKISLFKFETLVGFGTRLGREIKIKVGE